MNISGLTNEVIVEEIKNEQLFREFRLKINAQDLSKDVDQKIIDLSKKIKKPGFRPGKVPLSIIKKEYYNSALNESVERFIQLTTDQLLKERQLRPATKPKVDIDKFDDDQDLNFKLSFEVIPRIDLPDFSTISLTKLKCKVNDSQVDEALERLKKDYAEFIDSNQLTANLNDALIIDFEGVVDNEKLPNGTAQNQTLILGSKTFIEGFEEQLIGSAPQEERLVEVTFPDDYKVQSLANKQAQFKVKVNKIMSVVMPELNDEFAKKLGLENIEELKNKIKEKIINDTKPAAHSKLKKELFDELEKKCDFLVPQTMLKTEFEILWQKAKELKEQNQEFVDKSEAELQEIYQHMAKRRVKLGILLSEVANLNNITVDNEDLRKVIHEQIQLYPEQKDMIINYYQKNNQAVDSLRGPIIEDKAVEIILKSINLREEELEFNEFSNQIKQVEEAY